MERSRRNLLRTWMPVGAGAVLGLGGLIASSRTPEARAQAGIGVPIPPGITVSGTGEVRVAPDEASVRLGVSRQRPRARDAQLEANTAAQAIHAAIGKLGIAPRDIQTSELNLNPVYAQNNTGGEPKIVAYQASNVVTVRLAKLDQVGPVIDVALPAGANRVDGVSFGLKSDTGPRSEALTRAVADARRKAETISKALGVLLGAVLDVQESSGGIPQPVPMYAMRAMGGAAEAATPVAPGELNLTAGVTIRFQVTN